MPKTIKWTDDMLHTLTTLYPTHTLGDIADVLGISDTAVSNKGKELGLKRSKSFNPSAFVGRYTFKKYRRK